MPHSSGGGSHSGGSHSGGSSRSYSGSGSSGGSYSSGSYVSSMNLHRISRRPYKGARRYVYYDRSGTMHSVYRKGFSGNSEISTVIGAVFLFSLFAVPIIVFCLKIGLYIPRPLDASAYDSSVYLSDSTGLTDTREYREAVEKFKKATGVAPGIEIVNKSEWENRYNDLETFAYSEYLRLFDDEKHWLVVISIPDDFTKTSFVNWEWEGMIGDDCYPAFNSISEALFTKTMQKYLIRSSMDDFGEHIAKCYEEFSETGMERQISTGYLIFAGLTAAVYLVLCSIFITDCVNEKKIEKCKYVPSAAKEYNCEYCGTLYVAGTVTKCPSCGAPIPANNPKYD